MSDMFLAYLLGTLLLGFLALLLALCSLAVLGCVLDWLEVEDEVRDWFKAKFLNKK